MPLPTQVQLTNTFNQWVDATNDIITTTGNASHYILVSQNATPTVSTGNISVNGVMTLLTLAATGAATMSNTLAVTGATTLSNTLAVTGVVTGGTYNGQTINATASLTGTLAVTGAATLSNTLAVTGIVTGGTYNEQTINATASFTGTVGITGVATFTAAPVFSSATASQAVFTDGSKALVSNAITGTGNVVMSASPTLTGTIGAASQTLSGTLDVTGVVTGGTYNGQTISSAANFTGTLEVAGAATLNTSVTAAVGGTSPVLIDATSNYNILSFVNSTSLTTNVGIFGGASGDPSTLYYIAATGGSHLWRSGVTGDFMTLSSTGLLTVSGSGQNTFSAANAAAQLVRLENTTNGATSQAYLQVVAGTTNLYLQSFSQSYTTAGAEKQAGTQIQASGVGGLSIVATSASGAIRFYTGGTTERWIMEPAGQFHQGTVSAGSNFVAIQQGGGGTLIGVVGTYATTMINFYNANGPVGSVTTSGSATTYNTASDARHKSDRGIVTSTDILSRTVIHDFDWISDGKPARGVFAQEAYEVAPFAVWVGSDDMKDGRLANPWSVDYSKYVPDLIVGWQQHDTLITQHDTLITQLAARIAALESQDN